MPTSITRLHKGPVRASLTARKLAGCTPAAPALATCLRAYAAEQRTLIRKSPMNPSATPLYNAHPADPADPAQGAPPDLLDLVDFKWLMAGEGHRIDLDRLRGDSPYIRGCLALAASSRSATLRQAAQRLARGLLAAGPPPRS